MPKQLAFQQRLCERCTIDGHKLTLFAASTVEMNGFGDQLFSRAALALNQYGNIGVCNSVQDLKDLLQLGTDTNDVFVPIFRFQLASLDLEILLASAS